MRARHLPVRLPNPTRLPTECVSEWICLCGGTSRVTTAPGTSLARGGVGLAGVQLHSHSHFVSLSLTTLAHLSPAGHSREALLTSSARDAASLAVWVLED